MEPTQQTIIAEQLFRSPSVWDFEFGKWFYEKYKKMPGSQHIATDRALAYLSACLTIFKPKTVLELGSGIGTMTDAMLMHPYRPNLLYAIEQNNFCQNALRSNLSHHDRSCWQLITTIEELSAANITEKIDMYVGDGGFYLAEEMAGAHLGTVFFAEGDRKRLRSIFADNLHAEWHVEWQEFGESHKWALRRIWRLHLPCPKRVRLKGCWIGQVTTKSND